MITLHHNYQDFIIFAMENGKEVGNIEYKLDNGIMTITHTRAHVEGRGIGRLLVEAAIAYAKSQGMKILPQCSYAHALMNRVEEYRALLVC